MNLKNIVLKATLNVAAFAMFGIQPSQTVQAAHPIYPLNPQRYILSATVTYRGEEADCVYLTLEDENEDEWYLYDLPLEVNQSVILIIDDMGTPDDFCDDFVTDVLYCNCDECKGS